MIPRCALLALVLMLGSCGGEDTKSEPKAANPEPTLSRTELNDRTFGSWRVIYEDEALGFVQAEAKLDLLMEQASVDIAGIGVLQATKVTVEGNLITLQLPTDSPTQPRDFSPVGNRVNPGTLSLGDTKLVVKASAPPVADAEVILTLEYDEDNDALFGQWRRQVDLNANLPGRRGHIRYGDNGQMEMVGREIWQRPAPVIATTFATDDQFSHTTTGPIWRYPFDLATGEPAKRGVEQRYLMIIGQHLPKNIREAIELESDDPLIYYRVYRTEDSYPDIPEADWYHRKNGLAYLDDLRDRNLASYEYDSERDDFLIVHATLKPGIQPGRKTLRLNGVETEWLLAFGDHAGEMGLARDLTRGWPEDVDEEMVLTEHVYQSEVVHFEFRAHQRLPMQNIGFFLSKNGQVQRFQKRRNLLATPVADNPLVYRSEPIYLIKPGTRAQYPQDAVVLEVTRTDRVQASLVDPIVQTNPLYVDVAVLESPLDLRRAIAAGPAPDSITWESAVLTSARCGVAHMQRDAALEALKGLALSATTLNPYFIADAAISANDSLRDAGQLASVIASGNVEELTRSEAETITDYAPTHWIFQLGGALDTQINVGQHAGMLLLRQTLLDLLNRSLPVYTKRLTYGQLKELRKRLEPLVLYNPGTLREHQGEIGLNKVSISAPDGNPTYLETSFYTNDLKERYKLDTNGLAQYEISAIREARTEFAKAIRTTIKSVEAIDECDTYELLQVTGFGMGQVAKHAKAGLMLRTTLDDRPTWVPDTSAQMRPSPSSPYG